MKNNKKLILYIGLVLLLIVIVGGATYAYILGRTNEEEVTNNSGMVDVDYTINENITGVQLIPSDSKSGGLHSVATAKLKEGSVNAGFNIYITPSVIEGLDISALKWEVIGTNNNEEVYTNSGNFSGATMGNAIKIVDSYALKSTDTTFDIYIWLDASLITTSIDNKQFKATISADSVQITGNY